MAARDIADSLNFQARSLLATMPAVPLRFIPCFAFRQCYRRDRRFPFASTHLAPQFRRLNMRKPARGGLKNGWVVHDARRRTVMATICPCRVASDLSFGQGSACERCREPGSAIRITAGLRRLSTIRIAVAEIVSRSPCVDCGGAGLAVSAWCACDGFADQIQLAASSTIRSLKLRSLLTLSRDGR